MHRLAPFRPLSARQLSQLEERMQAYYASVPDCPAFHAPSHHPLEWRHLLAEVRRRSDRNGGVAILEFGSGRSGFPTWLRQQLGSDGAAPLSITCQDVTATNQAYLQEVADQVLIGPLAEDVLNPASFDLIFCTHCFEHVARLRRCYTPESPCSSLAALCCCPPPLRPALLPQPSCANLPPVSRLLLALRLLLIRCLSSLRRKPAFFIDTAPACLDRPFVRDADAIHWVSERDVQLFARRQNKTSASPALR